MTYEKALDVSLRPWSHDPKERLEAIAVLQIVRATSVDGTTRQEASDAVDRLVWWGRD